MRGNLKFVIFEGGSLPLFYGHGIVPTAEDGLYAGHLRRDIPPDRFYVHGTGVHGGRPCLVLRTEAIRGVATSFEEFWVDLGRQAAIVRYAAYEDGKVTENYDIHYDDTRDGWMPASWSYTIFLKGKAYTIKRFRVVSREVSLPLQDEDFHLEVRPGMRVRQVGFGETPNPLAIPATQGDTMEVVGVGRAAPGAAGQMRWWHFLPWLGVALVAGAAGLLPYKARKAVLGRRKRSGGLGG